MSTFVLVPGFWLGGWAWRDVAAPLRAAGHDVHPVTLTGLAERAHLGDPGVDVGTHVTDVIATIEANDLRDVVLVGHSYAGQVVTAVAELVRDRIAVLGYVDSGPLPAGMSHLDVNEPAGVEFIRGQLAEHGDYPLPSWEELERLGSSLAGVDDAARERWRCLAVAQPAGTVTGPTPRGTADPGLPKVVIACSFTAEQLRELAAVTQVFAELADPQWRIRELPTGHWPMFSEPVALAAMLGEESGGGELRR